MILILSLLLIVLALFWITTKADKEVDSDGVDWALEWFFTGKWR